MFRHCPCGSECSSDTIARPAPRRACHVERIHQPSFADRIGSSSGDAVLRTVIGISRLCVVDGSDSATIRVNLSPVTGGALNIWQAKEPSKDVPLQVYAPGLHHVCFNVESKEQLDELARRIPLWGGSVTDPPGEYPYTDRGTYYAVYFRGPDNIKLECVYMSELRRLHESIGTLGRKIWPAQQP